MTTVRDATLDEKLDLLVAEATDEECQAFEASEEDVLAFLVTMAQRRRERAS